MSREFDAIDEACDHILKVVAGCGGLVTSAVERLVSDVLEAARDQEVAADRAHGLGLDAVEQKARTVVASWRGDIPTSLGPALQELADALGGDE